MAEAIRSECPVGDRINFAVAFAIPLLDNPARAAHPRPMKIFLDGAFVDAAEAKVSVFDHGLLYGDGVFEGIRIYGKNIFRLDAHLERLEFSAKAIALKLPWTRAQIAEWTCEACRQNGLTDGYIRINGAYRS